MEMCMLRIYWKAPWTSAKQKCRKTIASHECDSKNDFLTVIWKFSYASRLRNSRLRHHRPGVQCRNGKNFYRARSELENWNLVSSFQRHSSPKVKQKVELCGSGEKGRARAENGSCLRNKNLKQNNKRTNKQTKKEQQQHEHFRKINANTLRIGNAILSSSIKQIKRGARNSINWILWWVRGGEAFSLVGDGFTR